MRDNCIWMDYSYALATMETRLTKNIVKCSLNVKDYLVQAKDWTDLWQNGVNYNFIPLLYDKKRPNDKPLCEFDEIYGKNT